MPIVESKIRNSSKIVFCLIILISFLCFAVLYFNRGILLHVLDFRDPIILYFLCFGVISVITISSIIRLLVLFSFESLNEQNSNILEQLKIHLAAHGYLCFFLLLTAAGCFILGWLWYDMQLKFHFDYFLLIFFAGILSACITLLDDFDDVDLAFSQNMEKSIGAAWAHGAYSAFYKNILIDITRRMSLFEKENAISLLVKKLVIICPLSCNANGSLDGKDGEMEIAGKLQEVIIDEGGNNDRTLKTNVYKICGPSETYIAAEIPSPLATLYEMRHVMDEVILRYHRDCFIQTLRDLLRSDPCIILEYDDLNSPQPLHSFLLSKLKD